MTEAVPEPAPSALAAFVVHVDGRELQGYDGDTIAAVLVRDGRVSWRRTRTGDRPRGLFCGIGACYDCLVSVDGVRGVRACVAPAFPEAYVSTDEGAHRG